MTKSKDITISAIAALGNQRQIGKDNDLLWHIPEDLQRFKDLTAGKTVIMGRETWESLPEAVRPLPNRENIILTRDADYEAPGGVIVNNLEAAISAAKNWSRQHNQNEVFIIGGANVYKQALPQTDKLYLTLVDTDKSGDAFFPEYQNNFTETKKEESSVGNLTYTFVNLVRK